MRLLLLWLLLGMEDETVPWLPGKLGTRREAVEGFLLGALKEASWEAYTDALRSFRIECEAQGITFAGQDEDVQDWILAEHVLDLREEQPMQRQRAVVLVAALSKLNPGRRYRTARKVLDRWHGLLPPKQAPACPDKLLHAAVVSMQIWSKPASACVCLLCFCGLLRVSEALKLRGRDIVYSCQAYVLLLGETKRGVEEKVVLSHVSVVRWISSYLQWRRAALDERVFEVSYNTVQRWFRRAAEHLGFGALDLSTHSLRRGGATSLLRAGVPFTDIMIFGRWRSDRSAREYLRQGEVALIRQAAQFPEALWCNLDRIARLNVVCWMI